MNKYLKLAAAMRENRGNWSAGYKLVIDALEEFTKLPMNKEDYLIEEELEGIIYGENSCFVDGRRFRDCKYNYDYLEEKYGSALTESAKAFDSLLNKTGIMNDTCAFICECLNNRKECENKNECEDYKMTKCLQGQLTELERLQEKGVKPIEGTFYIEYGDSTEKHTGYSCECDMHLVDDYTSLMSGDDLMNYCPNCGTKLDWSDMNE